MSDDEDFPKRPSDQKSSSINSGTSNGKKSEAVPEASESDNPSDPINTSEPENYDEVIPPVVANSNAIKTDITPLNFNINSESKDSIYYTSSSVYRTRSLDSMSIRSNDSKETHQSSSSSAVHLAFTVLPKSQYSTAKALHTHKRLGLASCIKIIIGCTVGSGVFTTPQSIVSEAKSDILSLCIWLGYGCMAWLGALCYAELGTTFPVSSGDYAYLNESFGSFVGFLYQWSANLVFVPVVNAVLATVVANNFVLPFTRDLDPTYSQSSVVLVAMAVIMFVSYIICVNPTFAENLRQMTFFLKVLVMALILIAAIIYIIQKNGIYTNSHFSFYHENYKNKEESTEVSISNIIKAIYQASFSYLGFNYLNLITEELRNPIRTLPVAIYISLPIVVVSYLIINFCYFVVLSPQTIINTKIIASDMISEVIPEGELSLYAGWLIPTIVGIAVTGTLIFRITAFSRVAFVGSRCNHVPKILALLSVEQHSPVVHVFWSAILSCVYVSVKNTDILIVLSTHLEAAFTSLSIYALIYMRFKRPDLQRPVRLPIFLPIIYAFANTILFLSPIITVILDLTEANQSKDETRLDGLTNLSLMGGAIFLVLTGIPTYLLFIRRKTLGFTDTLHLKLFRIVQKTFILLPEPSARRIDG